MALSGPMSSTARTIALSLALLLIFLTAVLAAQYWLRTQAMLQRMQAIDDLRARVDAAVVLSNRAPQTWDAAFEAEIGKIIGAEVRFGPAEIGGRATADEDGGVSFVHHFAHAPAWQVRVTSTLPTEARLLSLQRRTLSAMGLLALLLAIIPVLVALWARRNLVERDGDSATPWAATRQQAAGLEHFARISHERGSALARESDARRRIEEDLSVNRSMLDRSLSERVRLGRELHDNICQTLYAVCLTLESVHKKLDGPGESAQRLRHCLTELRRVNQQVRAYLDDLEPQSVWRQSFETALDDMLQALPPEASARVERKLDPEALALIPAHQVGEVISIIREAVSNSLRHGGATSIVVRAGRGEGEIALAVQDNGAGFASAPEGGHGLGNMRARAAALGGELRIESAPSSGTRVLLSLPIAATATP